MTWEQTNPSRKVLLTTASAAIASAGFLSATPAQAQQDEDAATRVGSVPAIVVIGEKIDRSYLETFTSVGVVTADDLAAFNIGDTNDAYELLANVRSFPSNRGNNGFMIRGLNADGVTQPSNSTPLISVIIDGVTQSAEGLKRGSRGVWDADRIEVLRGPQSTLQGRNALAGAVVVKTKDPTFTPEASARVIVGELDRREGAAVVSGPIIEDTLALRVSGEYREEKTDVNFTDPANARLGEDEFYNLRGKLLYTPAFSDQLTVLLMANHTFDAPTAAPVSGPAFFDRVFNVASTFTEFREMKVDIYSADIAYALKDGLTLRSISAYNATDLDIASAPGITTFVRKDTREDSDFTQEFRLEIGSPVYGVSGVAGLYYGSFEGQTNSSITVNGNPFQDGVFKNETETIAAYADLRYGFTERLDVLFGGRYQRDEVRNAQDVNSISGVILSDREADFNVFLPKAGLSYGLTPTQNIAVTANRGYRQGFTEIEVGTTNIVNAVDPEYVWTYEIAYRLSALDERLTFGANVFYNDYKDQQIAVIDADFPPLTNTRTAAESSSYGAELQAQYDFGDGLRVFGSLGLLETELEDFREDRCPGGDCSGNDYPEAPAVTAAIGGAYAHPSGFFGSANVSYTDEYFTNIENTSSRVIDNRFLANARLGYAREPFSISLYVENLFDEEYLTGLGSDVEGTIGDARNVGVELRVEL